MGGKRRKFNPRFLGGNFAWQDGTAPVDFFSDPYEQGCGFGSNVRGEECARRLQAAGVALQSGAIVSEADLEKVLDFNVVIETFKNLGLPFYLVKDKSTSFWVPPPLRGAGSRGQVLKTRSSVRKVLELVLQRVFMGSLEAVGHIKDGAVGRNTIGEFEAVEAVLEDVQRAPAAERGTELQRLLDERGIEETGFGSKLVAMVSNLANEVALSKDREQSLAVQLSAEQTRRKQLGRSIARRKRSWKRGF